MRKRLPNWQLKLKEKVVEDLTIIRVVVVDMVAVVEAMVAVATVVVVAVEAIVVLVEAMGAGVGVGDPPVEIPGMVEMVEMAVEMADMAEMAVVMVIVMVIVTVGDLVAVDHPIMSHHHQT